LIKGQKEKATWAVGCKACPKNGNDPPFYTPLVHGGFGGAYAWSYREGDQTRSVSVLEIPPVDSPQSAVKVAIAAKAKKV